jgi:hypothetical protein
MRNRSRERSAPGGIALTSESRTALAGDVQAAPRPDADGMHKLTLIALVMAAMAAGCGTGDKTLTKSQVIARGSTICKTAEKRVEALPQPTVQHPFAKGTSAKARSDARRFLAGYANALEYSRAGLAKLDAPKQDRPLLERYLTDLTAIVAQFRLAARAPAPQVEQDAMKAFAMFEKASSQTKKYGFPKGVCQAGAS